jgi:glycogen operon protein
MSHALIDRGAGDGKPFPLGASCTADGVNFSVYSRNGTGVELLLFDRVDDSQPSYSISLDPSINQTNYYWHVFVRGVKAGQIYGYRVSGLNEPERGFRFDPTRVLVDPYGKSVVVPSSYSRRAASELGANNGAAMKSVVADTDQFDWEGDVPLHRLWSRTIIYEMHVGGFTRHPSSGVTPDKRGTYMGLIEKIPYLQELGITAVELMPVFQFDEQDAPDSLINYWGYAPVSFFAPHSGYSRRKDPLGPLDEFREMVKALHRAGIEVILDVVFNHTAEGSETGPTFCFRGFDNPVYYHLQNDRSRYADYTGTGNTLNANRSIVRRMILDSLRYWVEQMHVDGFRFDLASVLSRDEEGHPMLDPPVIWDIDTDPVLTGTKLIAEAWDAGGLYQLGSFVGDGWKEWNGKFRDDIRSFIKGDCGIITKLPYRLVASPDVFAGEKWRPERSINFITCHDGFTLNDLVSYNAKHNESNREGNRDGADDNLSWNCGVEGPTDDPAVEQLRNRQVKNFLTLTLLAVGTPMLLMGDEVRRTQRGNNNAYCHDDETSWFDWTLLEHHGDVHRFVQRLLSHRLRHLVQQTWRHQTLAEFLSEAEIQVHGVKLGQPDWDQNSHSLALTARQPAGGMIHVMINAYWEPLAFEVPLTGEEGRWRRWIDTSLTSPDDICEANEAPLVTTPMYLVQPRSIACLMAQQTIQSQSEING